MLCRSMALRAYYCLESSTQTCNIQTLVGTANGQYRSTGSGSFQICQIGKLGSFSYEILIWTLILNVILANVRYCRIQYYMSIGSNTSNISQSRKLASWTYGTSFSNQLLYFGIKVSLSSISENYLHWSTGPYRIPYWIKRVRSNKSNK